MTGSRGPTKEAARARTSSGNVEDGALEGEQGLVGSGRVEERVKESAWRVEAVEGHQVRRGGIKAARE